MRDIRTSWFEWYKYKFGVIEDIDIGALFLFRSSLPKLRAWTLEVWLPSGAGLVAALVAAVAE